MVQEGFPGGSDGRESACIAGYLGLIPGSGRFPGEGNSNPFQYSCLENPMDGRAWFRLLSMGSQRVGHDWATSLSFPFLLSLIKLEDPKVRQHTPLGGCGALITLHTDDRNVKWSCPSGENWAMPSKTAYALLLSDTYNPAPQLVGTDPKVTAANPRKQKHEAA